MFVNFGLVFTLLTVFIATITATADAFPDANGQCHLGLHLDWTAKVGAGIFATPRVVDLFHDGRKELLVPTFSHYLEALDGINGDDVSGFPFAHPRFKTYSSPLPIDIDGNGKTEWLVAMYSGELLAFGEDGSPQPIVRVPPLAMKRDWKRNHLEKGDAAQYRASNVTRNPEWLREYMKLRKLDNFTGNGKYRQEQSGEGGVSAMREDAVDRDVGEEESGSGDDDFDEMEDDSVGAPYGVGPDGWLSAEAKASMDLLFQPELYRGEVGNPPDDDAFNFRDGRGALTADVRDDEVAVDAHILSTPVVVDINGDGDLDVVLHVSYFFDEQDYSGAGGKVLPKGIHPDDYMATAAVCIDLLTKEVKWVHVLELSTRNDTHPAYGFSSPTVINSREGQTLEVYISSTVGGIVGLDGRGEVLPGWPVKTGPTTATVGTEDVNGDGVLDLCVGDSLGGMSCFHANGQLLWRAEVVGAVMDRVTFGDVNGDGVMDVTFGTSTGLLYALNGATGAVLTHFPVSTGGPIIPAPLLIRLSGAPAAASTGLHLVVPSHDGSVYVVDGRSGCVDSVDIDAKSSAAILAEDLTGNGKMDLVVSTLDGGVFVIETHTAFHPLKVWSSEVKGLNGHTASEDYVGVEVDGPSRIPRDVRGDNFFFSFNIVDHRQLEKKKPYRVMIFIGTRILVHDKMYLAAGKYTVRLKTPLERLYASVTVVMVLPNGQVHQDSVALSFNMHFLETIKFTFLIPFFAATVALCFVHKRHQVQMS